MLKSVVVGMLLMAFNVAIHAVGSTLWIQYLRQKRALKTRPLPFGTALRVLSSTAIFILVLHIIEVTAWAVVYLSLNDIPELRTFEQATYFSIVTFTSLGYGDITLQGSWRLLSGIEAMNGIILFGWSTALLFTILQRLWTAIGSINNEDREA